MAKLLKTDGADGVSDDSDSYITEAVNLLLSLYKTTEICSHCEENVEIDAELVTQLCPLCHNIIVPCSLCEDSEDCINNCPVEFLSGKEMYSNFKKIAISKGA